LSNAEVAGDTPSISLILSGKNENAAPLNYFFVARVASAQVVSQDGQYSGGVQQPHIL
jgi:hypothetical protein